MNLEYNPFSIPLVLSAALLLGLAIAVWQYRVQVGERIFSLLSIAVSLWVVAFALELMSPALEDKMVWIRVEYVGIALVSPLCMWFTLRYTKTDHYMKQHKVLFAALFLLIPIITISLVWTSDFHTLFYESTRLEYSAGFPNFDPTYSTWFWIHVTYSYFLIIASSIWLVRVYGRSSGIFRSQIGVVVVAFAVVLAGNFVYVARLAPFPIDYTPYAFTLACIPIYWGLFRYHLFGISPVAREQVFESIADAVLTLNDKAQVVDINRSAEALLRRAKRDVIGAPIADISTDIAALVCTGADTSDSIVIDDHFYQVKISAVYQSKKQPSGHVVLLHDVTEARRAAAALRDSEARYRAIVEDQSELICRWNAEEELTFANGAFLRFFQVDLETVLGVPLMEYLPEPEQAVLRMLYTTRTPEQPVESYEQKYINPNERVYWIDWRIRALFDEAGRLLEYQAVGNDITKRKKSEEALLERRRTMHLIFSSMPNTLIVVDDKLAVESFLVPADLKLPLVNKSDVRVGAQLSKVFSDGVVANRFLEEVQIFRTQKISRTFEHMFEANNEQYHIGVSIQPVTDSTSTLIVIDDITEVKRAEGQIREYAQELEERNAELDTFTRTVAHDLKAPLASIVLYADFLLEYERDKLNKVASDRLEKILGVATKMGTMIDDLLTLARLRSAQRDVVPVNMDNVANATVDRLRAAIEAGNVQVELESPLHTVIGHEPWLEQVLANLIGNAVKYIGENNARPEVRVKAIRRDNMIRYEVIDNGPGISDKAQRQVFNMFTRFDRKTSGHGLGLSIVARIIEKLNGQIGLESELGIGSTFWFELPVAQPDAEQTYKPESQIDIVS